MTNKPRIAFLLGSTTSNGGIERVTSIIADELSKRQLATIHAIGYQPQEGKQVYEWNNKVIFKDILDRKESMKTGIFKATFRLRKYLKIHNIDILVACGHIYAPLAGMATFKNNVKMIYWSHSSFYGEPNKFKKINEYLGSFLAEYVICLTKKDIPNYQAKTPAKKVLQIYNPVDEKLFNNTLYNADTNKIISVGRLDHPKNFETYLLEVANIVLKKNLDYTWHIYGKGSMHELIKKNISIYNLEGRVILEGNVKDIYNRYNDHSIMVMTSSYEGFPMSLLEGMAKKLPMISFDIPTGPSEIIEDGKNGFLIPTYDCSLMANKLENLLENRDKRIEFSQSNEDYIQRFKIEVIIKEWIKLLENLAKK